jgi:serine kinase of HPr protein (carbohydrate metabolism regulator)
MQTHQNVIAIASLKEFSVLILVDGNSINEEDLQSARDNDIAILVSPLPAYETIQKLVQLGL